VAAPPTPCTAKHRPQLLLLGAQPPGIRVWRDTFDSATKAAAAANQPTAPPTPYTAGTSQLLRPGAEARRGGSSGGVEHVLHKRRGRSRRETKARDRFSVVRDDVL
jgi:hypothetical protein